MPSRDRFAPHLTRFADMVDDAFRRHGADGLPPRFRNAVAATPRHRFMHRFRIADGPLRDFDADPDHNLPAVYSDEVMRHVDAKGELLPSSNSQPSYVLWLLHLLGLEPGHAVLEIGSGSGWLAAIMARLVGPDGRVSGIELIADLAEQSHKDLAALNIGNVEIIAGDGTRGHAAGAPYDRAIITAATWDVPTALFDQVADGGCILVPIELRSGDGCDVTVLRRQGAVLVAERAVPGWFVPLLGAGQQRGGVRSVDELPFWKGIGAAPAVRYDLPLGAASQGGVTPVAAQFRAFLGRTEPGLVTHMPSFGLADEAERSVALWNDGQVTGFGNPSAARRLTQAYLRWAEAGLPGVGAFRLEVHRAGAVPAGTDHAWMEQRGGTALVWRLRTDSAGWRRCLAPEPP